MVFDSQGLVDLLKNEWSRYYWIGRGIAEAVYATPALDVGKQYELAIITLAGAITEALREGHHDLGLAGEGISAFFDAATRFKHQGFKEEREVRIVAIPGSKKLALSAAELHPDENVTTTIKDIIGRPNLNRGRSHLHLFDGIGKPLPIKRVIVGPSPAQDQNYRRVLKATGKKLQVVRSETPFV